MSSQTTIVLQRIVSAGVTLGARGIHLTPGSHPLIRRGRGLEVLPEEDVVTPVFIQEAAAAVLDRASLQALDEKRDVTAVMTTAGMRFKVNVFYQKGALALSLRPLASKVTPMSQLHLPQETLNAWLKHTQGLIVICGPTGSGRSTVVGALLQSVNRERQARIMTLENPIEVLFANQKGVIEQREVGSDAVSWQAGITSFLEEDADMIYLSDVPNRDVAQGALRLASAGHLVLCRVNASDTVDAIDAWASMFSVDEHLTVRHELATHLIGVLGLRLVPRIGGGEILAYEVLGAHKALANTLRSSEWPQARTILATAGEQGILTLDHVLADLVKKGIVNEEDARKECVIEEDFNRMIKQ